jgi:Tetratricopeptide repeat
MRTVRSRSVYLALFIAAASVVATHADAISDLDDAAARMQYAFYTSNPRGIEDALAIVQRIELPASRKGANEYYTAYGYWKLAALHADEIAAGRKVPRSEVTKAANACVKAAEAAITKDSTMTEAQAIEAVCAGLASRAPEGAGGCARHKGLRTARELEPNNPRIQLIELQCTLGSEKNPAVARERLMAVVKTFESLPPASPGRPDWGQPEALLMLGQAQLKQGDTVAARDSLERALVLAPDYHKARSELEPAASRPR